ncbi:MAG: hypothetical protein ACTSV7_04315 [Candidatus Baldrarchaeia archaeon]|nr:hypothetical protein [Candidatus Baldrarchaeota archaeon]
MTCSLSGLVEPMRYPMGVPVVSLTPIVTRRFSFTVGVMKFAVSYNSI